MGLPVIVMEQSRNDKLGDMSCTYVTQASCSSSCQFKNHGCYAETGFVGIHTHRLNRWQREQGHSHEALAKMEADGIDAQIGRAHV